MTSTDPKREVHEAAQALIALGSPAPSSGTVVRRGARKTSYLLECPGGFRVACRYRARPAGRATCERAAGGLAVAFGAGLGPRPLQGGGSPVLRLGDSWWTAYEYLHGPALWGSLGLEATYRVLGRFAATWHNRCRPKRARRHLMTRFEAKVVPREIAAQAASICSAGRAFLHGDLNASNIILTPAPRAIDFDEVGTGPPELDLALALGYVNTSAEDLGRCFAAILSGYRDGGGSLDTGSASRLARIIPWYMLACHAEALVEGGPAPLAFELAAGQAAMIAQGLDSAAHWRGGRVSGSE